jgi:hypothetical protein
MITLQLNTRQPTSTELQTCLTSPGDTAPIYRFVFNATQTELNADAEEGWLLFQGFNLNGKGTVDAIEIAGANNKTICSGGDQLYSMVGQAVSPTSTAEFLIHRSWTYGEISQTALLFVMVACGIFALIYNIFKKKLKKIRYER